MKVFSPGIHQHTGVRKRRGAIDSVLNRRPCAPRKPSGRLLGSLRKAGRPRRLKPAVIPAALSSGSREPPGSRDTAVRPLTHSRHRPLSRAGLLTLSCVSISTPPPATVCAGPAPTWPPPGCGQGCRTYPGTRSRWHPRCWPGATLEPIRCFL